MNDQNKSEDIEEYHFTEDTEVDPFATESTAEKGYKHSPFDKHLSRFNRRNILAIIGLIIILLAIYKLGSMFWYAHKKAEVSSASSTVQPATVSTQTSPATFSSNETSTSTAQNLGALPNNEQMSTPQNQSTENQTKLQSLQDQLNSLSTSVTSMQNNLSTITAQLKTLTTTVHEEEKELVLLEPKHPPAPIVHKIIVVKPIPKVRREIYFIKAMIPGRAWLVTPDGDTDTVVVGEELPGYGIITRLDPLRGIVMTSSGAIIRY